MLYLCVLFFYLLFMIYGIKVQYFYFGINRDIYFGGLLITWFYKSILENPDFSQYILSSKA